MSLRCCISWVLHLDPVGYLDGDMQQDYKKKYIVIYGMQIYTVYM